MKKRVISALLMILLFVPIVILGRYPYIILFGILGLIALNELLNLEKKIPSLFKLSAHLFTLFLILYNCRSDVLDTFNIKFLLIISLFYFISVVLISDLKKYNYKDAIYLIAIILFIGLVFHSFIIVRNLGSLHIIYLFLIAALTDTFALFCGKYLGKHKLSKISPNKTVEGSIGGSLFGTLLTTLICVLLTGAWDKIYIILGVTFLLSILGQVGDLFFSSIKRYHGIKDFGNLIPGHGGILDRVDSVIFILLGYIIILF